MSGSRRRTVLASLLGAALLAAPAAAAVVPVAGRGVAAGRGPLVQAMVVGIGGRILAGDRWVSASAATLRVGARSCAVAAGTPLAALLAVRRSGGPGFAIRDYGRCGGSAASSAQLFVYAIGGERNAGQSGWEYKVEGTAGSGGAGDPSGPNGDGRLIASGQRVLWFWCEARAEGCERTLEASPARAAVAPGSQITVTVTGRDNEGRGVRVAGARVALGGAIGYTDRRGRATLTVPRTAGGYWLTAERAAAVPSFPGWIVVR